MDEKVDEKVEFELYSLFDQKPVESLKRRRHVISWLDVKDETSDGMQCSLQRCEN